MRIPREPPPAGPPARSLQIAVLNRVGPRSPPPARERRDASHGPHRGSPRRGAADLRAAGGALDGVEGVEGITELVCHPGLGDAELAGAYDWGYEWERETAALCDPRLPELLQARGIELTSFSRLAASPAP